jgi:hypothetical protein
VFDYNQKQYQNNPGNPNMYINDGNLWADGSLSVNIFYPTGTFTNIYEEPAVTFTTLLPDLGGRLGLFLGISILSFVEIFEAAYDIGYALVRRVYIKYYEKNKRN